MLGNEPCCFGSPLLLFVPRWRFSAWFDHLFGLFLRFCWSHVLWCCSIDDMLGLLVVTQWTCAGVSSRTKSLGSHTSCDPVQYGKRAGAVSWLTPIQLTLNGHRVYLCLQWKQWRVCMCVHTENSLVTTKWTKVHYKQILQTCEDIEKINYDGSLSSLQPSQYKAIIFIGMSLR